MISIPDILRFFAADCAWVYAHLICWQGQASYFFLHASSRSLMRRTYYRASYFPCAQLHDAALYFLRLLYMESR